mmetsp:Transcript_13058/g.37946  ORF Transcript_13058/g.37946 Transcript_13058/m.37946 type:complete len:245 (-) Transcript_13058:1000-1734(-)
MLQRTAAQLPIGLRRQDAVSRMHVDHSLCIQRVFCNGIKYQLGQHRACRQGLPNVFHTGRLVPARCTKAHLPAKGVLQLDAIGARRAGTQVHAAMHACIRICIAVMCLQLSRLQGPRRPCQRRWEAVPPAVAGKYLPFSQSVAPDRTTAALTAPLASYTTSCGKRTPAYRLAVAPVTPAAPPITCRHFAVSVPLTPDGSCDGLVVASGRYVWPRYHAGWCTASAKPAAISSSWSTPALHNSDMV